MTFLPLVILTFIDYGIYPEIFLDPSWFLVQILSEHLKGSRRGIKNKTLKI